MSEFCANSSAIERSPPAAAPALRLKEISRARPHNLVTRFNRNETAAGRFWPALIGGARIGDVCERGVVKKRNTAKISAATLTDHQEISQPLRRRKGIDPTAVDANDPVARAEAALAKHADEFARWMAAECRRLDAARKTAQRTGLAEPSRRELFRAAHDIKGEAATFGFPSIAPIAESLCRLIEQAPDRHRIPLVLVDQHVDAICTALRGHGSPGHEGFAATTIDRLRELTDSFLHDTSGVQPN